MKITCPYCENEMKIKYFKRHLQTRKHNKTKFKLIDRNLLSLPKEINLLIFEYWNDTLYEKNTVRELKGLPLLSLRDDRINEIIGEVYIKPKKWYMKFFYNIFPFFEKKNIE